MPRLSIAVAVAALALACGGSYPSAPASDLVLRSNPAVGGSYLTAGSGRALYYFTHDLPAAGAAPAVSNCAGGCLDAWAVYDAGANPKLGDGLDSADFGELTRVDGSKQTTFKGYPLYTFYADGAAGDIQGENVDKAWFVLRSPFYTSVVLDKAALHYLATPEGKALYTFTADTQGTATTAPASACNAAACLASWKAYAPAAPVVPTGIDAASFASFARADGTQQATWKGHPLYTFVGDTRPGDTGGNGVAGKWFVVDASAR